MNGEEFAKHFVSYANANDIIMVFPQSDDSFEIGQAKSEKAFTRDAEEMKFFKGIVDRATTEKLNPHEIYQNREYKWDSAYPSEPWMIKTGKCNIKVVCESEIIMNG